MKFPSEINAYCPKCRKKTKHKVRMASKGKARGSAWGNRQHERTIMGYVGKVAGEKAVKKQGKKQKIILECSVCKKKQERIVGKRTSKKLELKS
jgi:large subunit ribosomal protein L44e